MDDETRGTVDGGDQQDQQMEQRPAQEETHPSLGGVLDDLFVRALESVEDEEERVTAARAMEALKRAVAASGPMPGLGEAPSPGVEAGLLLGGSGVDSATSAISKAKDLGFVEFTTSLISGTFDAIVTSNIKQIEAYSKLVADLAKSLEHFQTENVTDADVTAHLAERYPDGTGGTVVKSTYEFKPTAADTSKDIAAKTATAKLTEVAGVLEAELKPVSEPNYALTIAEGAVKFTADQVIAIRPLVGKLLASSKMSYLRAMASDGMTRLVVSNGKLLSKLTFRVDATDVQTTDSSKAHTDSAAVNVKGSAGWGWGKASVGGNWNQLNVSTVNQTTYDAVTMDAEMIGLVEINFATETFPSLAPPPLTPA